jgi:hypothetical protein
VVARGLSGGGDDLGRGAGRVGALPGVGDEAIRVTPTEEAIQSLAEEASLQALDLMLEEPGVPEPVGVPRALGPLVISVAPRDAERFSVTFGRAPSPRELASLGRADTERVDTRAGVLARVAGRGPMLVVLGHARSDAPERLLTHDGAIDVVEIQQKGARAGRDIVIAVCESDDFDASCAEQALASIEAAAASSPRREHDLVRALLAERTRRTGRGPTLHRVVASEKRFRRVHSREP